MSTRVSEAVIAGRSLLREGGSADVLDHIDGALMVDLWGELVLPPAVREAWNNAVSGRVDEPRENPA